MDDMQPYMQANKYANKSVRGPAVKACQEAINEKYKNTMVDANGNLKAGAKNKFAGVLSPPTPNVSCNAYADVCKG